MSRIPDEAQSWPTEADGGALLGDLRQQVETARRRLGEQWNQQGTAGVSAPADSGDGGDLST